MSNTLTYHSIQNFQLCHHNVGKGIGPYAPAPAPARAQAQHPLTHPPALADAYAHANAAAPQLWYCVMGSTSVICKMTILQRRSPCMDDLVRSNPPSTSILAQRPL
ncbi:hypothetical protein O181_121834 [Austropuccinia psidii MF-1]|uniref:Uncharacterized protein n=1 Tax=Austropuccinia psidii MF-1 TaxID=1389203 RepID=A0A9Q3KJD6_9BASI|nr:hypothetical protein [Austropuccinia psidii MF-1]